mgnify:CR=1 FL=1
MLKVLVMDGYGVLIIYVVNQEFYRKEAVELYDQIEPEHKPEADKTIDELSGFLSPEHASRVRSIKFKR